MTWNNVNNPFICYTELFDGSNYKDEKFRSEVKRFLENWMPGGPMGLLNREDVDRWQVEPDNVHVVEEATLTVHVCPECEAEYDEADTECCTREVEGSDVELPLPLERQSHVIYVIRNTSTRELVDGTGYSRNEISSEDGETPEGYTYWREESDAQDNIERLDVVYDAEEGYQSRFGYPWANSWWYLPDRMISTEHLKAAGFTVATYCGGAGDWRNDEEFRMAGIDGGGYSFEVHYVRLYVLHAESRGWETETEQGAVNVTYGAPPSLLTLVVKAAAEVMS